MRLTKRQQAEIALVQNKAEFFIKGRNCVDKSMGRIRRSKARLLLQELRRLKCKPKRKAKPSPKVDNGMPPELY